MQRDLQPKRGVMSVFEVFWDKFANILLLECDLSGLGLEDALISVDFIDDNDETRSCGLFAVKATETGFSQPVAVTVDVSGANSAHIHLEVVGTQSQYGEVVRESESLSLLTEVSATAVLPQTTKWCVAGQDPQIHVVDGQDTAPDHLISKVYLSPREGMNVYPAVSGDQDGEGGVLEVAADIVPSEQTPEDPSTNVLTVSLTTVEEEPGMNTQAIVYSLSAALHVLPLLTNGDAMRLSREDNFCRGDVTLNSKGKGELLFASSRDDPSLWAGFSTNTSDARMVDLLDRVVVETSPPATFIHRDSDGNPQKIGRRGVAVLSLGPTGLWHADNGSLVDRILQEESGFSGFTASTFASDMSESGYRVGAADLDCASEITVFVYAASVKRASEALGSGARTLMPRTCASYCAAAEAYTAISMLSKDDLDQRTLLAARGGPKSGRPSDMLRPISIGMLKRRSGRKGLAVEWAQSADVDGWAVYAATLDDTIFAAAVAGLLLDSGAIAMLLGDTNGEISHDIQRMAQKVNALVSAGVLASDGPTTLEDISALDDRARRLEMLGKQTTQIIADVSQRFGPFDRLPPGTEGFISALSQVDMDSGEGLPQTDRVTQFFYEYIESQVSAQSGKGPNGDFALRLSRLLRSAVDEDARHIERLIAAGLRNPIQLQSDNVMQMGMQERPASFAGGALGSELVAWLHKDDPHPAIIAVWRRELRAAYEQSTQVARTTGS